MRYEGGTLPTLIVMMMMMNQPKMFFKYRLIFKSYIHQASGHYYETLLLTECITSSLLSFE